MLYWIVLFGAMGVTVFWYSRKQPFPEISSRFALFLLLISVILWLGNTAPRGGGNDLFPAYLASITGGSAVIYGVIKMSVTKDDVVVAPFGGILFCVGSITLLSERWSGADQLEQIGSFILASILVSLELYLIFRGLIIGVQGISWSKSGLRQISRGLIQLGVQPNDKVAIISMTNRTEWNICDIGILQTGAQDVPIYPTISQEDYAYILNHSQSVYCFVSCEFVLEKINNIKDQVPSLKGVYSFDTIAGCNHWEKLLALGKDES